MKTLFGLLCVVGVMFAVVAIAQEEGVADPAAEKPAGEIREEDLTIGGSKIPPEMVEKLKRAYAQKAMEAAQKRMQATGDDSAQSFQWAHEGVTTTTVFPDHPTREFIAGKEIDLVAGLHNGASKPFTVFAILASLYHPQNERYFIQNFSARRMQVEVPPGEEISLTYKFVPDPSLESQAFKLLSLIFYHDETVNYTSILYNGTIRFLETPTEVNVSTLGAWVAGVIAVCAGGYFGLKSYWNKSKKDISRKKTSGSKKAGAEEIDSWLVGTAAEKELREKRRQSSGKK